MEDIPSRERDSFVTALALRLEEGNFGKNHVSYAHLTFRDVIGSFKKARTTNSRKLKAANLAKFILYLSTITRLMGQNQNSFSD